MRAEKKVLGELTLCYCVAPLEFRGKRHFLVASEKQHPCLLFDEQGVCVDQVWDGPGGTMTMVQLPGADGAFLATHRFYSPNDNKQASIVLCRWAEGTWQVRTLLDLPGVHRFDLLERGGAIMGIGGASNHGFANNGILTIPTYSCADNSTSQFVAYLIGIAVAFFGAAVLTYIVGFEDDKDEELQVDA